MESLFNPFTESTAGPYFVGREAQIEIFRLALNGLKQRRPSHMFVAGLHGTGKTSYLERIKEIATSEGIIGAKATLDETRSAVDHINSIITGLLAAVEQHSKLGGKPVQGLVADWERGSEAQHFGFPRANAVSSDKINADLIKIASIIEATGCPGTVICVDEAQRINPHALSALKNAVQGLEAFLLVLSLRLVQVLGTIVDSGRSILDERAKEAEGDFGASRLFVQGASMGPFDSPEEAKACIEKRLEDNLVSFDDDVIDAVGRITGRVPHKMISLSSAIYTRAVQTDKLAVDISLLQDAFRSTYGAYFKEAVELVGASSSVQREVLRRLVKLRGKAKAEEIASQWLRHSQPNIPSNNPAETLLADAVAGVVGRIVSKTSFIDVQDEAVVVSDQAYLYALELALGKEVL